MQNMKKKGCDINISNSNNNNGDGGSGVVSQKQQKERHIVSWSQEEDDILREQIAIHGTDNWAIVASKFSNKTTRQCRRRWFTYLNSDFKKGGWSQEEDMLLCEAQKIFGNRWTEIAKVVSGRTDNAVKNRFSTLCKKRAKNEALAKENNTCYTATNNKRARFHIGQDADRVLETSMPPSKMRRKHIPDTPEELSRTFTTIDQQLRPPFAVLIQKCHNVNTFTTQPPSKSEEVSKDGMFLKKDDPKIIALLQQAELLSSLASKVNMEKTDESYENACKAVQDFLKQNKDSNVAGYDDSDMDFQNIKDLVHDICCDEGSQQSWRETDFYQGSPDSSEYSTGSTALSQVIEKIEPLQDNNVDGKSITILDSKINQASCDEVDHAVGAICPLPNSEFNSPIQVTPLFRSMAAGIPSPQFSESERNFLLKTLGMESTPTKPPGGTRTSQPPPPCKRALLHCL
ncbi:transcription factor MYB124-like isoform X2 [Rutidosis leptorrhynchoides]|uniref:transcription factor MYB124-like isoform X2 n=1 Tax=Rutidosis leptorrhynchoides TaxID=125765 RepID=UPI003A9A4101